MIHNLLPYIWQIREIKVDIISHKAVNDVNNVNRIPDGQAGHEHQEDDQEASFR